MRIAVTGTPGTGKTAATGRLPDGVRVTHLNELIREAGLWTDRDSDRGSVVADLDAVADRIAGREGVIESHLAHLLPADRVVVLRCAPATLRRRLRDRGESPETAAENAESEALDVVLSEAVERHGREAVYEIETTDRSPDAVAAEIRRVIEGDTEPSAGTVDYTGYLHG